MHQQLKFLHDTLEVIDNDPQKTMQFYTGCCIAKPNINNNPPPSNIRWLLIEDILHKVQHFGLQTNNEITVSKSVDDIFYKLNDIYQRTQHYCWDSHVHHFHTSFRDYINCPVTCITEIVEYIDKITKEVYHT